MKIAYAGDWHANFYWAAKAIEYAKDLGAETIVHLGDYGYDFPPEFRTIVEDSLRRTGLTLQFVDGNHEDFTWLYKQPIGEDGRRQISERVWHLPRGYRWEWEGIRFLAVGGARSIDRKWRKLNHSWWQEEEITDEDINASIVGGEADVLVAHEAPEGFIIPGIKSHMWNREEVYRCEQHRIQLRRVVDLARPKEIWHGHYHVRYDKIANFGYGPVEIHSLDMDATELDRNILVIELQPNREPLLTAMDVELRSPGPN